MKKWFEVVTEHGSLLINLETVKTILPSGGGTHYRIDFINPQNEDDYVVMEHSEGEELISSITLTEMQSLRG